MSFADGFTVLFVSFGAFFFFAGLIGLLRFPDTLSRLHALSKADNLGLGLVLIGLLPQASWPFGALKLIALWVLAILVGGATGQMLAGAIRQDDAKTAFIGATRTRSDDARTDGSGSGASG